VNNFRVVVSAIADGYPEQPNIGFADAFRVSRPGIAADRGLTGYVAARRRRGLPPIRKGEVVKIIVTRLEDGAS
jgi:hypothetical protein